MSSPETPNYQLLTSTRYDNTLSKQAWNVDLEGPCPFLLLSYHVDRLREAASQHGWVHAIASVTYDKMKVVCQTSIQDLGDKGAQDTLKLRVTLSKSGEISAFASPIDMLPQIPFDPFAILHFTPTSSGYPSCFGPVYDLYLDSEATDFSLFTITKTTQRGPYNAARQRAGLSLDYSAAADVIMYNSSGEVTESSIFNIALYRTSGWITPARESGCLPGVMRRWLLEQGCIREPAGDKLLKEGLKVGEWVLLFNSVRGCLLGRICKTG